MDNACRFCNFIKIHYFFIFSIYLLLVGCAGIPAQKSTDHAVFSLDFENTWKAGHYSEDKAQGYYLIEFIKKNEEISNWTEMVTSENMLLSWGGSSAFDALKSLMIIYDRDCPGITEWKVLERLPKSVSYEYQMSAECKGFAPHYEVGKIMDGEFNRFRVRYTRNTRSMPPEERERWVKWINETVRVQTNPASQ